MRKYIFGFISGILVSFIFVVFAAIVMKAEDISFNNELSEATNVNEAIDELYTKCGIRKGEIKALIPKMTSNTCEVGTAFCYKANGNGGQPYLIFDENESTHIDSSYGDLGSVSNESYGFDFNVLTNVTKVYLSQVLSDSRFALYTFKLQYSKDGSTWIDASPNISLSTTNPQNEIEINNDNYAYQWRIKPTSSLGNRKVLITELQFYGYQKDF